MLDVIPQIEKTEVVRILEDIATLLEFADTSVFEVMAFRNGAQYLDEWNGDLADAVANATLTEIYGIGKGLASVISDLVLTGKSEKYDQLRTMFPETLLELRRVPGLGTKKIKTLYEQLGIDSLDSLERAAKAQNIRKLKGFGAATEERIIAAMERSRR
ncbi:MAG: helix-hairpin-helix domain-containing protein [Gammaproteobacteria bacterium]|nr:helix-hairpin-helix domain-containing protein [Gammaproteobacteria bacterium]